MKEAQTLRFCEDRTLRPRLEHLRHQVTEYSFYIDEVVQFAWSKEPESRGRSRLATGKVSYTGQVKGKTNNPYPTAFSYGNGMVLHFYQQQESSTTKTVHKVINKGLKTYV